MNAKTFIQKLQRGRKRFSNSSFAVITTTKMACKLWQMCVWCVLIKSKHFKNVWLQGGPILQERWGGLASSKQKPVQTKALVSMRNHVPRGGAPWENWLKKRKGAMHVGEHGVNEHRQKIGFLWGGRFKKLFFVSGGGRGWTDWEKAPLSGSICKGRWFGEEVLFFAQKPCFLSKKRPSKICD